MELSNMVYEILRFTNAVTEDEIIIENCGNFAPRLDGYSITLPRDRVPSMQIFLKGEFPEHKDEIDNAFSSDDSNAIIQCCKVYYTDSLTEKFIDKAKSIDNLVKYGPKGDLIGDSMSEEIVEEGEDEEMIAELKAQIEEMNRQLEQKDKKIAELSERIPTGLDDEVVSIFLDVIENDNSNYTKDAVYNAIMDAANNDDEDGVALIIGIVLDQFMKNPEVSAKLGFSQEG